MPARGTREGLLLHRWEIFLLHRGGKYSCCTGGKYSFLVGILSAVQSSLTWTRLESCVKYDFLWSWYPFGGASFLWEIWNEASDMTLAGRCSPWVGACGNCILGNWLCQERTFWSLCRGEWHKIMDFSPNPILSPFCSGKKQTSCPPRCLYICPGLLTISVFSHHRATPDGNQSKKVWKEKRQKRKKRDRNSRMIYAMFVFWSHNHSIQYTWCNYKVSPGPYLLLLEDSVLGSVLFFHHSCSPIPPWIASILLISFPSPKYKKIYISEMTQISSQLCKFSQQTRRLGLGWVLRKDRRQDFEVAGRLTNNYKISMRSREAMIKGWCWPRWRVDVW